MEMKNNYFNEECLKSSDRFGERIIVNTCTYEEVRIPWDITSWFTFITIIIATLVVIYQIVDTLHYLKTNK